MIKKLEIVNDERSSIKWKDIFNLMSLCLKKYSANK